MFSEFSFAWRTLLEQPGTKLGMSEEAKTGLRTFVTNLFAEMNDSLDVYGEHFDEEDGVEPPRVTLDEDEEEEEEEEEEEDNAAE